MDQQEQKRKSSALNNLQNIRSEIQVGRFLISQGTRLAAGALSGLGLPLLIAMLVIFIFTFLIVGFVPGGSGETGTTPQPTQPPIISSPPATPYPSQPSSLLGLIVQTAQNILGRLTATPERKSDGTIKYYYDAKLDEGITGQGYNLYWCTYLIVDSYNKIGISGLTRALHAGVINMKSYFVNSSLNGGKLRLLSPAVSVGQLRPGDTIFFEGAGGQHVSLIRSIDVDENGHGMIRTYDSNNVVLEDVVSVRNNKALKAQTIPSYAITGFGQAIAN